MKARSQKTVCGEYYCIDLSRNVVAEYHVDLEKMGREMGVLKHWEEIRLLS